MLKKYWKGDSLALMRSLAGLMVFFLMPSFGALAAEPLSSAWVQTAVNFAAPDTLAGEAKPGGPAHYSKGPELSGALFLVGSRTFINLVPAWISTFKVYYPNLAIQFSPKWNAEAVQALMNGKAQLGPINCSLLASEIATFADKLGYKPTSVPVALDAVAVIVHKNNSLPGMSLEQLDSVYSRSLKRGGKYLLDKWEELGVGGELGPQQLVVYTRPSDSGTFAFFSEQAILGGEMRPEARECTTSTDMMKRVGETEAAIGFAGLSGITSDVRIVPVGETPGNVHFPDEQSVSNGSYPFTRCLMMVMNRPPNAKTDPLVKEFLRFILSAEGQTIAKMQGFFPLPQEEIAKAFRIME